MKVAVVCGGHGAEREVSLASGAQVWRALKERGHEVVAVDTARGVLGAAEEAGLLASSVSAWPPAQGAGPGLRGLPALIDLPACRGAEVFFLALHGGAGEDGTLQSWLDLAGVPYTGSRRLGSTYAFDKDTAKRLFRSAGVPTPDWLMAPCGAQAAAERLGFPVIVKPNKQGSTVGLTLVKEPDGLAAALAEALRYDDEAMVEAFVAGREFTVGILDDRPLTVGEIVCRPDNIFDYESKYRPGGAREIFPAPLSAEETQTLQSLALCAHRVLKLEHVSRIDFRQDARGGFWCLEANSLPGLTATSLLPQSAAAAGIPFPQLCERLCLLAIERNRVRRGEK